MIINEAIVVVFCILVVIVLLFRSIVRVVSSSVNMHCNNIHELINNSHHEKELSADKYDRALEKNKTIEDQIAQVLNVSRLEAKLIANKGERALEAMIKRKMSQEKLKLARKYDLVIEELKERIIDISANYSYKLTILKGHDKLSQNKIFDFAVKHIPNRLH